MQPYTIYIAGNKPWLWDKTTVMGTISKESLKDILLADDDQDDVMIFELALKETKMPVYMRHAKDGDLLFVLLEEQVPDMLFLDVEMPCKDGIACIAEIRKNEAYDNMPVIMYTSHNVEKYISDSFRNRANLYLNKSNSMRDLVDNLKMIFSIDWKRNMVYPSKQQYVVN